MVLEIDCKNALGWFNLGCENGGKVHGLTYLDRECFSKAVECDLTLAAAWKHLGLRGGGWATGKFYSSAECDAMWGRYRGV